MTKKKITPIPIANPKGKYSPETVALLVEAIKLGSTIELACDYAGIHKDTFYEWLKDDSKSDFSDAIKEARGGGAVELLNRIQNAAKDGTWQAAAWILERRYPSHYGRQIIEHEGSVDHTVTVQEKVDLSKLTFEEIYQLRHGRKPD